MNQANCHHQILLDRSLLSAAAYFFCRDAGLIHRYGLEEPAQELVRLLADAGVLSPQMSIDRSFGYACYEYYRQQYASDELDSQLLEAAANRKNILDLCCGPGATIHAILRLYPAATVYALDQNDYYLSLLRSTLAATDRDNSQVIIQKGDAHRVPLQDQALDFIACRTSLQYLNVPVALQEMFRLLAPGGRLYLIVHGPGYLPDYWIARNQWRGQAQRLLSVWKQKGSLPPPTTRGYRFLSFGPLKKKLEQMGFTDVSYSVSKDWLFAGHLPVYYAVTAVRP
ncbi:hypothetical protein A7K91_07630 [Paenibacillus oryzae]|uniref:Methyltransferase domain-containing protein n=1 Tax=Paenibacillus oryzae TaxID=1844972 RepID=A0A1A5YR86_9BACL|nr:methyltransferase domain-containing protein [Paenibacillus oryzae]OBR68078.1 hypothetical protein A7K91_07630 [Paenibacillus oryzae]